MQITIPPLPSVKLPGRNGLIFMGGMAALGAAGVVSGTIALALGVLPVLDANLLSGDGQQSTTRRRTPVSTTGTATRRARTTTRTRAATSTARRTTRARSGTTRRAAPAAAASNGVAGTTTRRTSTRRKAPATAATE